MALNANDQHNKSSNIKQHSEDNTSLSSNEGQQTIKSLMDTSNHKSSDDMIRIPTVDNGLLCREQMFDTKQSYKVDLCMVSSDTDNNKLLIDSELEAFKHKLTNSNCSLNVRPSRFKLPHNPEQQIRPKIIPPCVKSVPLTVEDIRKRQSKLRFNEAMINVSDILLTELTKYRTPPTISLEKFNAVAHTTSPSLKQTCSLESTELNNSKANLSVMDTFILDSFCPKCRLLVDHYIKSNVLSVSIQKQKKQFKKWIDLLLERSPSFRALYTRYNSSPELPFTMDLIWKFGFTMVVIQSIQTIIEIKSKLSI